MSSTIAEKGVLESVRVMLAGAIDYAGLYPPAGLSMSEAVLNYAMYRNSNYSWMLGKFVVGVNDLDEFFGNARDFISHDAESAWHVTVVASDDLYETVRVVENFNLTHGPHVICDSIEMRTVTTFQIQTVASSLPPGVKVYFEIAPRVDCETLVAAVAAAGQCAKLRTGGVVHEAFPSSERVVRFVEACVAENVPFKATAGLHHPIRCFRPLTYAENAGYGTMHGFLNLFLMTGFAREGYRPTFLESVMEEEFEEVFQFTPTGVKWRNELSLSNHNIEMLRETAFRSFGSCSFDEPIADLRALGIL
jgi:hypothetical protein